MLIILWRLLRTRILGEGGESWSLWSLYYEISLELILLFFMFLVYTYTLQAGRSRVRFPMRPLNFSTDLILALGSTQPLTEVSTRNLPGCEGRPVDAWGWQPDCHLWADCLENVEASTSHNPMGLHGLLHLLPLLIIYLFLLFEIYLWLGVSPFPFHLFDFVVYSFPIMR
jgi:hypothetical protein